MFILDHYKTDIFYQGVIMRMFSLHNIENNQNIKGNKIKKINEQMNND